MAERNNGIENVSEDGVAFFVTGGHTDGLDGGVALVLHTGTDALIQCHTERSHLPCQVSEEKYQRKTHSHQSMRLR